MYSSLPEIYLTGRTLPQNLNGCITLFLRRVTAECPALQIIIIAGNHDSAARLEAPNPLLEEMNITVRGVVKRDADGDIDLAHLIIPIYKPGLGRSQVDININDIAAFCLAVPLFAAREIIRLPKTMRKVFRLSIGNFLQN